MYTEQMSQGLSIAATPVLPQTLNGSGTASASTGNSGVDMSRFHRALFVVQVGSVTGGGSLSAKLQTSANGTSSWNDVTGSSITAITASNKVASIEIRADEMPSTDRYVRCTLTETGNQNVVCACLALGGEAIVKPASANDVATVAQRLVV
jgi:hypothetical protein